MNGMSVQKQAVTKLFCSQTDVRACPLYSTVMVQSGSTMIVSWYSLRITLTITTCELHIDLIRNNISIMSICCLTHRFENPLITLMVWERLCFHSFAPSAVLLAAPSLLQFSLRSGFFISFFFSRNNDRVVKPWINTSLMAFKRNAEANVFLWPLLFALWRLCRQFNCLPILGQVGRTHFKCLHYAKE